MNQPTHQLVNKATGEVWDILSIDFGTIRMETPNGAVIFNVIASDPQRRIGIQFEVREYVAPVVEETSKQLKQV